jgi:Ca2+/H+ antiporter
VVSSKSKGRGSGLTFACERWWVATAFFVGEAVVLVATVFAALWHAEVVAHRVGEPFGTLVLALAQATAESVPS